MTDPLIIRDIPFRRDLFIDLCNDLNNRYWLVRWGLTTPEEVREFIAQNPAKVEQAFMDLSCTFERGSTVLLFREGRTG